MAKKEEFYLAYGPLAVVNKEMFKQLIVDIDVNGIKPIEYEVAIINSDFLEAFATGLTVIKCKEQWRKTREKYTKRHDKKLIPDANYKGLPVYF